MEHSMAEAYEVLIPLLNPNEPEVQIVEKLVENGQKVVVDDVLCKVETTKSSHELTAEWAGYIVSFDTDQGDKLRAGQRLCWLAEKAEWIPPEAPDLEPAGMIDGLPQGIRITQPALELVKSQGIDLGKLSTSSLITEAEVQQILSEGSEAVAKSAQPLDSSGVIIYGGGGHGKALIDLVRASGSYRIVGIIDDGLQAGTEIMEIPVLGGAERLQGLANDGIRQAINAVGGIGDMNSRIQVFRRLQAQNFEFPNLVHPTAWVEPGAKLLAGVHVFPHAYIGSEAQIGLGVIINTAAVISHDCVLQDYVNIAPGAVLAGNVSIGEGALVGMGVTINLNVHIGQGAKIGNSAVIKSDVPADQLVRAGMTWPPD
jgi:sugar O-acyltransferase (sialic acid O-acetyltransferase NeuD family)